jgi:hypothetical protein
MRRGTPTSRRPGESPDEHEFLDRIEKRDIRPADDAQILSAHPDSDHARRLDDAAVVRHTSHEAFDLEPQSIAQSAGE